MIHPTVLAIPEGARPAARIVVLDAGNRVLLLHAMDPEGNRFWLMPGGGLDPGETFEEAARRELLEETGIDTPIGPWVWARHHQYLWNRKPHNQYERYFVARTEQAWIRPLAPDGYIVGYRWWTVEAVRTSSEQFVPQRLPELVAELIEGRYPDPPIDCGV